MILTLIKGYISQFKLLVAGVVAFVVAMLLVWIRAGGKSAGRKAQAKEDKERIAKHVKEIAKSIYAGRVGTDDLRVRDDRDWKPRPPADK